MITQLTTTPIIYYPDKPNRNISRIEMKINDAQIAWADFFVEEGWAHFVYVYVQPQFRTEETIMNFIRSAFNLDLGASNIFWFGVSPSIANFYQKIIEERTDLTFAATGVINKIVWATE